MTDDDPIMLLIAAANGLEPVGVARPLLELTASLSPDGVPIAFFTAPATLRWVTARRGLATSTDDAGGGLSCLFRLRLATRDGKLVRLHQTLPASPEAARVAADALAQIWDVGPVTALRANTGELLAAAPDALWKDGLHPVVFRSGNSLPHDGLYAEAVAYWSALLGTAISRLGEEHPDTLTIRNNLAWSHGRNGDPARARDDLDDLLSVRRRVLGPDAVNTLATAHGVAVWTAATGDATGAAGLLRTLLDDCRRVLGHDHRDTLNTRLALAGLLSETESPRAAVDELRLVLRDYQRVLGYDDPETLDVDLELIRALAAAGSVDEALSRMERLVADFYRVLGPGAQDTLRARYLLADLRAAAGHPSAALSDMRHLLADVLRTHGPDRPEVTAIRSRIAHWTA